MRKLLLPVDGDANRTSAAVTEALRLYAQEPVAIHLLSVQPMVSSHVAMFFGTGELHDLQQAFGIDDLASAKSLLDAAGVPYTSTVVAGRSAETIARMAHELGCDRIVMGPEQHRSFAGKVFGSLAGQVRHIVSGASNCQVIGS